jgi:uncharacterized membrane protein YgdD (TMEM256/DUF423 family)
MTPRVWLAIGAISGGLAVAGGAFGAHALRARLTPEMLAVFETGMRYQMYHALALLAVGLLAGRSPSRALTVAGAAFTLGTLLFTGSLCALSLGGARLWGAVTPFGGVAFLAGWLALTAGVLRRPVPSP